LKKRVKPFPKFEFRKRFKVVLVNHSGSKVSDIQNWSLGAIGTNF